MKNKIILLAFLFGFTLTLFSQDTIRVGIKDSPPFTMHENGEWKGLGVDLLTQIQSKTNYRFELIEISESYDEGIVSVNKGEYDLFLGSPTITGDRLQLVNFTQPFYIGSFGVATTIDTDNAFMKSFFTWGFLKSILYLSFVILFFGLIFWLLEKGPNDKIAKDWRGIFEGAFFVSFTMTTVGYTDTVVTRGGKILSFILMWVSIGFVGYIYGNITTALTVSELENNITDVSEMKKLKVGSILGTTGGNYLEKQGIKFISFHTVEEALDAINDGELDAFVYDTPILKYLTGKDKYNDIQVIKQELTEERYGLCAPKDSDIINKINPIIVDYVCTESWSELLNKYNIK